MKFLQFLFPLKNTFKFAHVESVDTATTVLVYHRFGWESCHIYFGFNLWVLLVLHVLSLQKHYYYIKFKVSHWKCNSFIVHRNELLADICLRVTASQPLLNYKGMVWCRDCFHCGIYAFSYLIRLLKKFTAK